MKKPSTLFHPAFRQNKWWRSFALIILVNVSITHLATAQNKVWDKSFGTSAEDELSMTLQTQDGGYILGGSTASGVSGDKTQASKGSSDFWLVKLKPDGSKSWDKTIGGSGLDKLVTVQQTRDGGYILGGISISGKGGDKSEVNQGERDYWVVKLKADGSQEWDKTLGGNSYDDLTSLQQTPDGGYILGGASSSGISGDKTETSRGEKDYWIVKLSAGGSKVWDKTYGGSSSEIFGSVQSTAEGGYILGGSSYSGKSGDKSQGNTGYNEYDYWIIKVKADGSKEWDVTLGGERGDRLRTIKQTKDQGYVIGGSLESFILEFLPKYQIMLLDKNGNYLRDKTFSGFTGSVSSFSDLQLTPDGGYILGGSSYSGYSLGDSVKSDQTELSRKQDFWLIKLNKNLEILWDKTLGGDEQEILTSLQITRDGGYVLGGSSNSGKTSDKSQDSKGLFDYWVVKLGKDTGKIAQNILFAPITTKDYLSQKTFTVATSATSGLPVKLQVVSGPARVSGNQIALTGTGTVSIMASQAGNTTYNTARQVTQSFQVIHSPVTQLWNKDYGGIITNTGRGLSDVGCYNTFGTSTFSSMVPTPDGGYLFAGTSDADTGNDKSADHYGEINPECELWRDRLTIADYWVIKTDANGNKIWDKTIGGSGRDQLTSVITTFDGGYLLGGSSSSVKSHDKSQANKGFTDYWVVKLDANGNKLWDKTFGGTYIDDLTSLVASPDGGFVLVGSSGSGIEGDKTVAGSSWIIKIDANGNKLWDKSANPNAYLTAIVASQNGGYVLSGTLKSKPWVVKLDENGNKLWDKTYDGDFATLTTLIAAPYGGYLLGGTSGDYWVVNIDEQGTKLWEKTFGGNRNDNLQSIVAAPDGGYLLGGSSNSGISGDKSEPNRYKDKEDYWLVKINAAGAKLWDKTFGGNFTYPVSYTGDLTFGDLLASPDGSYVLGGTSYDSRGYDKEDEQKGLGDFWIIKIKEKDFPTTPAWDMRYGGTNTDNLTSLIKTTDGGYLAGGYSSSLPSGDKTQSSRGGNDYWIVKSDKNGKKLWDKRFGGRQEDYLNRVIQTQDGGYLLAGSAISGKSGDKSEAGNGKRDYWLMKTDALGKRQWDKSYGGSGDDELIKVIQLATGEYVLGGYSDSPVSNDKSQPPQGGTDYWILKISNTGTKIWDKRYGGSQDETLGSFIETPDGGFLLAGSSLSGNTGDKNQASRGGSDYWVVQTDKNGNLVWEKSYGGNGNDEAYSIAQSGSHYYLSGTSHSGLSGDKSQASQGGSDYWVVKINNTGNKIWDKRFGGNQDDDLRASTMLANQELLVIAGTSLSGLSGNKTQATQGGSDYWVLTLDAQGNQVYDIRLGGADTEELRTVLQTRDGGLLLGGQSNSHATSNITQPNKGNGVSDYWLVKIAPQTNATVATRTATMVEENKAELTSLQAFPNPFSDKITISFTLPQNQAATIRVLDSQGQEVKTLFQQEAKANQTYQVEWQAGKQLNGMYLLQLQTPGKQKTLKLLLSK